MSARHGESLCSRCFGPVAVDPFLFLAPAKSSSRELLSPIMGAAPLLAPASGVGFRTPRPALAVLLLGPAVRHSPQSGDFGQLG
jgi:hypothetical protein